MKLSRSWALGLDVWTAIIRTDTVGVAVALVFPVRYITASVLAGVGAGGRGRGWGGGGGRVTGSAICSTVCSGGVAPQTNRGVVSAAVVVERA